MQYMKVPQRRVLVIVRQLSPRHLGPSLLLAITAIILALAAGCSGDGPQSEDRTPTPTPFVFSPTVTPTTIPPTEAATPAPTPTEAATPAPTPTPTPAFEPWTGVVVGGTVPTYAAPNSRSAKVRDVAAYTTVILAGQARGENWIVGDQTWPLAIQDWDTLWYRLDDGSYIYSAYVFLLRAGERAPWDPGPGVRSVVVDTDRQRATAYVGTTAVLTMPITSGKPGFETPIGDYRVFARVGNERMTSSQAGFDDPADQYDVRRVLFTQYFASGGFALHLNYWQPNSVFGSYASSHGCVGLLLHDAQYLWMFASSGIPVSIRGVDRRTPTPTASPTATPPPTPAFPNPFAATATPSPTPAPTFPNPFAATATPTAANKY